MSIVHMLSCHLFPKEGINISLVTWMNGESRPDTCPMHQVMFVLHWAMVSRSHWQTLWLLAPCPLYLKVVALSFSLAPFVISQIPATCVKNTMSVSETCAFLWNIHANKSPLFMAHVNKLTITKKVWQTNSTILIYIPAKKVICFMVIWKEMY